MGEGFPVTLTAGSVLAQELDTVGWVSTTMTDAVEVDSRAAGEGIAKVAGKVVARVDEVAELPMVLRAGMSLECGDG